jgi:hypothetical protein
MAAMLIAPVAVVLKWSKIDSPAQDRPNSAGQDQGAIGNSETGIDVMEQEHGGDNII